MSGVKVTVVVTCSEGPGGGNGAPQDEQKFESAELR
jgi:hypothetical protein